MSRGSVENASRLKKFAQGRFAVASISMRSLDTSQDRRGGFQPGDERSDSYGLLRDRGSITDREMTMSWLVERRETAHRVWSEKSMIKARPPVALALSGLSLQNTCTPASNLGLPLRTQLLSRRTIKRRLRMHSRAQLSSVH